MLGLVWGANWFSSMKPLKLPLIQPCSKWSFFWKQFSRDFHRFSKWDQCWKPVLHIFIYLHISTHWLHLFTKPCLITSYITTNIETRTVRTKTFVWDDIRFYFGRKASDSKTTGIVGWLKAVDCRMRLERCLVVASAVSGGRWLVAVESAAAQVGILAAHSYLLLLHACKA